MAGGAISPRGCALLEGCSGADGGGDGGDAGISGKETGFVPVGTLQAGYRLSGKGDKPMNVDVSYRYLYFLSGQNGLSDLNANSVFVNLSIPF